MRTFFFFFFFYSRHYICFRTWIWIYTRSSGELDSLFLQPIKHSHKYIRAREFIQSVLRTKGSCLADCDSVAVAFERYMFYLRVRIVSVCVFQRLKLCWLKWNCCEPINANCCLHWLHTIIDIHISFCASFSVFVFFLPFEIHVAILGHFTFRTIQHLELFWTTEQNSGIDVEIEEANNCEKFVSLFRFTHPIN